MKTSDLSKRNSNIDPRKMSVEEAKTLSLRERLIYFDKARVNHPKLSATLQEVEQLVNPSTGANMVVVVGPPGVGKGGLHGWTTGSHLPSFNQVIDIAQAFNCSIESVLAGDTSQMPLILPEYSRQIPRGRYIHRNVKGQQFRSSLIKLLGRNEHLVNPPSLLQISRILDADRSQILRSHPDIAKQITNNYLQNRSRRATLLKSIRHHAYREAAITLVNMGQVPTRNRVMSFLENISIFAKTDREACQAVCYEVRKEFHIQGKRELT